MRVAMVDPSLFTHEYDATLCDALGAAGHEAFLVARPPRPGEPVHPGRYTLVEHFHRGSERLRRSFPRGYQYAKAIEHVIDVMRLKRTLRRLRPDVVHFQWPVVPAVDRLAVRAIRKEWPVVLTLHNTVPFHGSPHSRAQAWGVAEFTEEFDALVIHGSYSAAALRDRHAPPMHVVTHGLMGADRRDGGDGTDGTEGADPARHDGACAPGGVAPLRILQFGRVRSYKGVDVLVDALTCLPAAVRERVEVVVAGVPEMAVEPLRERARAAGLDGRVRWDLRFIPATEVPPLFEEADVVVLPYREVDASGVLMKAVAYDTPAIVSAVGSFPDVVTPGENGLVVPPGDAAALASAIESLASDRELVARLTMGMRECRERLPGWDDVAARTVEVYEAAAERDPERTVRRRTVPA
ncbi:MAG TPA: glycosyltransferase family 4 protein [Acidimicrobiia bacterium]|nr:glycosyltransferase family 4 protein [Acidimicrobiia bacterium]